MYSRNEGFRPLATAPGRSTAQKLPLSPGYGGSRMPSYQRGRVEVPPGYSGHAIIDGEERPLGEAVSGERLTADGRSDADRRVDTDRRSDADGQSDIDGQSDADRRADTDRLPREPMPELCFDGLPRVSEVGMGIRRTGDRPTVEASVPTDIAEAFFESDPAPEAPARSEPCPGGGLIDPAHFPFGHGLGFEELLLLGLMLLMLYEARGREDRGDLDETVILLAALLLAG